MLSFPDTYDLIFSHHFGNMSLLFLSESDFIRGEFSKILGRSFFGYSSRWDIISAEGIIVG